MKEDLRILGGGCPRWGENLGSDCSLAASRMCLHSTVEQLWLLNFSLHPSCWGPKTDAKGQVYRALLEKA